MRTGRIGKGKLLSKMTKIPTFNRNVKKCIKLHFKKADSMLSKWVRKYDWFSSAYWSFNNASGPYSYHQKSVLRKHSIFLQFWDHSSETLALPTRSLKFSVDLAVVLACMFCSCSYKCAICMPYCIPVPGLSARGQCIPTPRTSFSTTFLLFSDMVWLHDSMYQSQATQKL